MPELVDAAAAITLSGYTRGHLRRVLMARTLTNYDTKAHPFFGAADLPASRDGHSAHCTMPPRNSSPVNAR